MGILIMVVYSTYLRVGFMGKGWLKLTVCCFSMCEI